MKIGGNAHSSPKFITKNILIVLRIQTMLRKICAEFQVWNLTIKRFFKFSSITYQAVCWVGHATACVMFRSNRFSILVSRMISLYWSLYWFSSLYFGRNLILNDLYFTKWSIWFLMDHWKSALSGWNKWSISFVPFNLQVYRI